MAHRRTVPGGPPKHPEQIKCRWLGYVARVGFDDAFTKAAQIGVLDMGLSPEDAMNVVMGLTNDMLYKSMTTHADHRVWQDVYHAFCPNASVVIQFKEM